MRFIQYSTDFTVGKYRTQRKKIITECGFIIAISGKKREKKEHFVNLSEIKTNNLDGRRLNLIAPIVCAHH